MFFRHPFLTSFSGPARNTALSGINQTDLPKMVKKGSKNRQFLTLFGPSPATSWRKSHPGPFGIKMCQKWHIFGPFFFEGPGQNTALSRGNGQKPSKTGPDQWHGNAHLYMPRNQKSRLCVFCDHFSVPGHEHEFMGLENLGCHHTVLGGQLSTFAGQLGAIWCHLHCTGHWRTPRYDPPRPRDLPP